MLIDFTLGQTSVTLVVKLRSTTAPFNGLTGLTFASSGLVIGTRASNEATATAYTAAGSTIETITTLGTFAAPTATKCRFKEVDATNLPGTYEVQIADARFAVSSAKFLQVTLSGVTGMCDCDVMVPLRTVNPYATNFGLTGNFAGSIGSVTGAVGSVTGAVGSVTGAVGSVTGNVGGNVVGSVASVTANVTLAATPPTAAAIFTAVLTTQLTEAYAAVGTAPTLAQAVFLVMQALTEFSVASTTVTSRKLDRSTTASTYTLDSSTSPTSRTRAS